MQLEEQKVTLRKILASEGKVIIRKNSEEQLSKDGTKLIYLGINDSPDNYEEIDEETYKIMYEEQQKNEKSIDEEE